MLWLSKLDDEAIVMYDISIASGDNVVPDPDDSDLELPSFTVMCEEEVEKSRLAVMSGSISTTYSRSTSSHPEKAVVVSDFLKLARRIMEMAFLTRRPLRTFMVLEK